MRAKSFKFCFVVAIVKNVSGTIHKSRFWRESSHLSSKRNHCISWDSPWSFLTEEADSHHSMRYHCSLQGGHSSQQLCTWSHPIKMHISLSNRRHCTPRLREYQTKCDKSLTSFSHQWFVTHPTAQHFRAGYKHWHSQLNNSQKEGGFHECLVKHETDSILEKDSSHNYGNGR